MLNALREELSRLYQDSDSARRIVNDAGIPTVLLDFDGPIVDVWSRIIGQADRRQMLANLVSVARREYPISDVLQQVYGALLYKPPNTGVPIVPRINEEPNFSDLVRRLEVVVNGSTDWNVEGLVPSVKQINLTIVQLRAEVAIGLAVVSVLLLISVFGLGYMLLGGS
jgi:hypothetical protein